MTRLQCTVNGYTDAAVTAALSKSGRIVKFEYHVLDSDLNDLGVIDGVEPGGTITHSHSAQIKRTGSLNMDDVLTGDINFLNSNIRPYQCVKMPDGGWAKIPLGTFVMSSPERDYDGISTTRAVDLYDLTQVLVDDKVTTRYVAKGGTYITDTLADLLSAFPVTQITQADNTHPNDRTWPPGTAKIDIVNKILHGLNYFELFFDAYGVPYCIPWVAGSDAAIDYTYSTDANSLIGRQASSSTDYFEQPNVFVRVITESSRTLMSSTFQNNDPSSPTSTVSRGRSIVDWQEANDAPDQASLDSICRQAAVEAAQIHSTGTINTVNMPFHGDRDVLTINHSRLGMSGQYVESGWTMNLELGATMSHTLRSVVPVNIVSGS